MMPRKRCQQKKKTPPQSQPKAADGTYRPHRPHNVRTNHATHKTHITSMHTDLWPHRTCTSAPSASPIPLAPPTSSKPPPAHQPHYPQHIGTTLTPPTPIQSVRRRSLAHGKLFLFSLKEHVRRPPDSIKLEPSIPSDHLIVFQPFAWLAWWVANAATQHGTCAGTRAQIDGA